jgi:hypothetical protein
MKQYAFEERDLHAPGKYVKAHEPALALDAIHGRVPTHSLVDAGHGIGDEFIQAAPDFTLPARYGGAVGLHRAVAVCFRNLPVSSRKKHRL